MAKKKKSWKKKLGKALMAGAALAGGLALAKRGKTPYRNVHETGAITQTPGRERWSPGVGGTQHTPQPYRHKVDSGFIDAISPGLAYGQQTFKKGGRVKGAGQAKRGLGRAFSKGRK